jgi:hypothetical protein
VDTIEWATGLFEGEGTFLVSRTRFKGKEYPYAVAALKMTDEDIVRRFAAVMVVGQVSFIKRAKPHHKDQWRWRCHGRKPMQQVFDRMKSMLGPRRIAQAQKVLASAL